MKEKITLLVPVILSGGVGSRLWPLSREYYPKQCLSLVSENYSLLQQTIRRLDSFSIEPPIVICNQEHRFLIAQQLHQIGEHNATILLEPSSRSTAPAIALGALEAKFKYSEDVMLLILPADHVIRDAISFEKSVKEAIFQAQDGSLVTFGVQPTHPETGYGYIRSAENFEVIEFVEKPSLELAQSYLASGDYLWNSGMFLFKADSYMDELTHYRSDISSAVIDAHNQRYEDMDFVRIGDVFSSCPNESVDYAVMEATKKAKVIPYIGDWSDIGSWDSLYNYSEKDENLNVLRGDVILRESERSLIFSESRLVTAVGVSNLVIIETSDAVLIINKDKAQDVKSIVSEIKVKGRNEHLNHTKVHRPWGWYQTVDSGNRHQVKRIIVNPGEKLSVQMHHHRAEHWVVVSGTAKVKNGDKEILLTENESTYIPVGVVHALENPGKIPLELVEVQSGSYLGEDDIVRFSDRYGR